MMKLLLVMLSLLISVGSAVAEPVVVGNLNGIDSLNASDAKKLFLGKLKTLSNGTKPIIIEYPSDAPIREAFHIKVTEKNASQQQAYWSQLIFSGKGEPPKEVGSAAAVIAEIIADPAVIGYVDSSEVTDQLKVIYKP
ncbi:phosphate ABC transporter substrate-binding protein [Shewanella sp. A14]